MRTVIFFAVLALSATTCLFPSAARAKPLDASGQVILVLADSFESRRGEMRLYERSAGGFWVQHGPPFTVELGKNGLGWGRGLHGGVGEGPAKREGDGKAPAGIFRLGELFGYGPAADRLLKMPYREMTESFVCVDDPASARYNQVLDASTVVERDWKSAEDMRRQDQQYELGAVVLHNTENPVPGAGSCVFLHVRRAPEAPTAGCTAMSLEDMERVAVWLDASKNPALVQIPRAERARFSSLHGTP